MKIFGTYLYKHVLAYVFYSFGLLFLAWEIMVWMLHKGNADVFPFAVGSLIALTLSLHFRLQSTLPIRGPMLVTTAYVLLAAASTILIFL